MEDNSCKDKNNKINITQEMCKYTMDTIKIIEDFLKDDEKKIIKFPLFSIYTSPEDAINEIWLFLTDILNKNFSNNEELAKIFNKRSIEFNNLYRKYYKI